MALSELTEHSYKHTKRDPANCTACAHEENPPNVAGWLRVWVPAQRPIPAAWFADELLEALEGETQNHSYLRAVLNDIRDFGVTVYDDTQQRIFPTRVQ